MAHASEAACLLKTGSMYTRRLGLRPTSAHGEDIFAGLKHGAWSLYFGDAPIYHFDLEGRWQRAFIAGTHYLKGLDTRVDAIERKREGDNLVLQRRALDAKETDQLDSSVRSMALQLIEALALGSVAPVDPPEPTRPFTPEHLRTNLESIARWDSAAWNAHRERYQRAYGPLGFVPPEGQQAVVLQATLGDADGVTFGHFSAPPHFVRASTEFEEHAGRVAGLIGKRALQCRGIYLAGSDLLRLPTEKVASYLRVATQVFPVDPSAARVRLRDVPEETPRLAGVYAFLDCFEPPLPDLAGWRLFQQLHLTRVILGIESGEPEVRRLYGKRWSNDTVQKTVADLKQAGLVVSVVTLVGAGGVENAEQHVAATAASINALPLGHGDLVYLIDAAEAAGDESREKLFALGLTPLPDQARREQQARLLALLASVRTERKAKVTPYSLEKQLA